MQCDDKLNKICVAQGDKAKCDTALGCYWTKHGHTAVAGTKIHTLTEQCKDPSYAAREEILVQCVKCMPEDFTEDKAESKEGEQVMYCIEKKMHELKGVGTFIEDAPEQKGWSKLELASSWLEKSATGDEAAKNAPAQFTLLELTDARQKASKAERETEEVKDEIDALLAEAFVPIGRVEHEVSPSGKVKVHET